MASLAAQPAERSRPRARHRARRTDFHRLSQHPRVAWQRLLLRLLYALPLAALALLAGTGKGGDTPNRALLDRVATIEWQRADVAWVGDLFPPVSTLLAALVPSALGLSLIGALAAGLLLQKLREGMVQRHFPPTLTTALLGAVALNPLFAYTAVENLPAFLGLGFFGRGMFDMVRFIAWRNTQSGFTAGVLFMLAVLTAPGGFLYVVAAVAAAPFLRLKPAIYRGTRMANLLVIIYPAVSALLALAFLETVFLGQPFRFLTSSRVAPPPLDVLSTTIFLTPTGWLILAPVAVAGLFGAAVRRPGTAVTALIVFVAIFTARATGLMPDNSAGDTFLTMTLLGIAMIPTVRSIRSNVALHGLAAMLIAIGWLSAFQRPVVVEWLATTFQVAP